MPQLIGAVIYAAGVTGSVIVAGTVISVASVLGTVIFMAGMAAYSAAQAKKAKNAQREAYNAAQVDRMANVVATVAPREIVLGRVRKGGPVAFRGSAGALNETFLLHIMLAGHEIDAVERVYLNDKRVTLDANGYVLDRPYLQLERFTTNTSVLNPAAGTVVALPLPSGPVSAAVVVAGTISAYVQAQNDNDANVAITVDGANVTITDAQTGSVTLTYQYDMEVPYAKVWWDLGTTATVADARTIELFPTLFTSFHRGRGVAKLIAELTYSETAFPGGVPQITARIRGAKVYDPRSATTVWSENPALLARYVYQHASFGKATISAAEDARFIAAANACDVLHGYVVDGVTENRPMYTAGTVGQFGTPASSLLDDLCQAMAGMWAFAGGELYVRAGVHTNFVITLTDADLAIVQRQGDSENQDQMTISVHRERAEKFNTVNLRIWDGGQDYKPTGLPPVKSAPLVTRDGVALAQEVTLSAVSHSAQAQHIAGVMMRDARDPLTVEAPFKMTAYPLELFDTVRLTLARYGWTNKTFMVVGRAWLHDKGVIKLTLKETAAAIFNPDATFLPQGYGDNTALPDPWNIAAPVLTAAGITSGTDDLVMHSDGTIVTRVRVTWAALTDARITSNGFVDIRWRPAISNGQWQTVTVDGNATEAYIVGPKDRRAIIIRARSRTSIAVSAWSRQIAHIVVGKTEPPAQVAVPLTATASGRRILLEWPDNTELDFAIYEVRTADAGWGTDTGNVYRGRASRVFVAPPASAGTTTTWYVKARDTGKRYSTLARSVAFTRSAPATVGAITKTVVRGKISLDFADVAVTSLAILGYEVRSVDSGWGTTGYLYRGQTSRTPFLKMATGLNTYYARAFDVERMYSAASATVSHTFDLPGTLTTLTLTRTGRDIQMTASGATAPVDLKHYEFRIEKNGVGDVWGSGTLTDTVISKRRRALYRPTTLGTYRISVRMVDVDNNVSAASASALITVSRPTAP